jgi:small subunit ribosomal protein S18
MVQNYEIYLIINPDLDTKQIETELQTFSDYIKTTLKTDKITVDQEGIKRLAYPVNKKWNGFYALFTFECVLVEAKNISQIERKLNTNENFVRFLIVNQTEYLKAKSKEVLKDTEINNHRELNKGRKDKTCIATHMGIKAVDYKDAEFLNQFTSPYAKLFVKSRTGTKSKFQRKVGQAVKRARHMALLPFTTKHFS